MRYNSHMTIHESREIFGAYLFRQGVELDRVVLSEDERLDPSLTCANCKRLLVRGQKCRACPLSFCQACGDQLKGNCPCGDRIRAELSFGTRLALSKLKITCSSKRYGCGAILFYENLEEHEENCHLDQLACIFPDCSARIERRLYPAHIQQCECRLLTCAHCGAALQFKDLKAHLLNCPLRFVSCNGCGRRVLNQFLGEHIDICQQVLLACERCSKTLRKDQIQSHSQLDCVVHLLKQFREAESSVIGSTREKLSRLARFADALDAKAEAACARCLKFACPTALSRCLSCAVTLCSLCNKDASECPSCSGFFCPPCFAFALQEKACPSCSKPLQKPKFSEQPEKSKKDK